MNVPSPPFGVANGQPPDDPLCTRRLGTDEARQRHRHADLVTRRPGATVASTADLRLNTPDGALSFQLRAVGSALYMQRICRRPLGTMQAQAIVFTSADEFRAWVDAEPLRFSDPLLHQRLCRFGQECFDAAR